MTTAPASPLEAVLRDHGARVVVRHGHRVVADFGSVTSETAVCRSTVGLADRSERCTFEVRGSRAQVAAAVLRVRALGDDAWTARTGPGDALVRCEPGAREACAAALETGALVLETTTSHVGLGLVGPRAGDVLRAAGLQPAIVLADHDGYEVLVPRSRGPAAWAECLRAGAAFGIACVGADAIEHVALARHLSER